MSLSGRLIIMIITHRRLAFEADATCRLTRRLRLRVLFRLRVTLSLRLTLRLMLGPLVGFCNELALGLCPCHKIA